MELPPPKQKIIQKRVAKREKYARMARIRYRKERGAAIAKAQDLNLPPRYLPQDAVYDHQLGFVISEANGELDNDFSFLNMTYTSNSVTVLNNNRNNNKMLCIKLHKNDHKEVSLNDEVIQKWEKRNDPYWLQWTKHFKEINNRHKNFIERNKDKFEGSKLDEEAQQRYRECCAQRDKFLANGACMELRTRFDSKHSSCSELIVNSGFMKTLNYEFDEFVQKILMEGIPRFKANKSSRMYIQPGVFENFESLFKSSVEVANPEGYFLGKNNNVKKVEYKLLLSAYFVKNAAEISYLVSVNNSKSLDQYENMHRPIYRLYLEQQMVHENERKFFLESFYPEVLQELEFSANQTCKVEESTHSIEPENGSTDNEFSTENNKMSEELAVRDTNVNLSRPNFNVASVPHPGLLRNFMLHFNMMKNLCQNKQHISNIILQQDFSDYLSKY